ncbi:hypothetical protein CP963_08665 [Arcobacter cloacae]|uniref:Uncharacterized protein n=1 Tax=Arcobacter cloacae TaxID=1054034 RepID=A0A6M8NR25_9BACT|nr:putative membrane protein [Arcobacter cloacae]RXI40452.1 hypothetical protein CP963_08665 [Arcobacter cloacae]
MSNYLGTIFRIIGIFLTLIIFWFLVSLFFVFIISFIDISFFNLKNIIYMLGLIFLVRIFYPRYIFQNK